MRWMAISMLIFAACGAACGGSSVEWAGRWKQPAVFPIGSSLEATLAGKGPAVTGSGVQHREAGPDETFTVSGNTSTVTLTYGGGSTEAFSFAQPDPDHLTWSNAQRTVQLTRQ